MEQLDKNHLFCQPLCSQMVLLAAKKMGYLSAYKINNHIYAFLMKKAITNYSL